MSGYASKSKEIARNDADGTDLRQRSSTLVSQARHTGPALAYDFMRLGTLVALLVAAVGAFSVRAAGGRQRATEMVALEVAGVRLLRSLAIEAVILALPSLPQLAARTDAPLSYSLPGLLILAVALGAVLVVTLATAAAELGRSQQHVPITPGHGAR